MAMMRNGFKVLDGAHTDTSLRIPAGRPPRFAAFPRAYVSVWSNTCTVIEILYQISRKCNKVFLQINCAKWAPRAASPLPFCLLNNVKPRTREIYEASIRNHLKPALGTIRLEALDTPTIQAFYNGLSSPCKTRDHALSPKTIKDLHGILHKALNQAAAIGYLRFNPADACNIPKAVRKELTPLDTEDIQKFLTEIRGNPSEILLSVTLFMGLREGEVLALS